MMVMDDDNMFFTKEVKTLWENQFTEKDDLHLVHGIIRDFYAHLPDTRIVLRNNKMMIDNKTGVYSNGLQIFICNVDRSKAVTVMNELYTYLRDRMDRSQTFNHSMKFIKICHGYAMLSDSERDFVANHELMSNLPVVSFLAENQYLNPYLAFRQYDDFIALFNDMTIKSEKFQLYEKNLHVDFHVRSNNSEESPNDVHERIMNKEMSFFTRWTAAEEKENLFDLDVGDNSILITAHL